VELLQCPADSLDLPDGSVDVVVCQQGFQFFPDRPAVAREVHRVLREGGKAVATTWEPVSECRFFGAICDAATAIGEPEIADMMRVPFDYMPATELAACFESAEFRNLRLDRQERDLVVNHEGPRAVEVAYATPIGPKLRTLPDERQAEFRDAFAERIHELSDGGTTMGPMVTNVVIAEKQTG
jgi:SAM-dependent methyltransferase